MRPRQYIYFKRPELYETVLGSPEELLDRYRTYLEDWTPDFHETTKKKVAELFHEMDNFKDNLFYKNPPEVIRKKLAEFNLSLD